MVFIKLDPEKPVQADIQGSDHNLFSYSYAIAMLERPLALIVGIPGAGQVDNKPSAVATGR